MERLRLLVCLGLICVASTLATVVDPRGARPVEPGTRSEKCSTQREWPFCTDDEWGYKCPSGCRIQGLMDKDDHDFLKKIEKIRRLLDQNRAKHRSAEQVSKQTYDYLKDRLVVDSGSDNNYYDLAQTLRQRITEMKIRIDRQLRVLAALKDRVKDQVIDMQRLEVDIDIKLRSCKGSCQRYTEYQVDRESYVTIDKQLNQLDSRPTQSVESVGTLYVMKSRPLQDVIVDSVYKSKGSDTRVAGQQRDDIFSEVKTAHLVLEEEGSSSSPATVSKDPGTSFSASTSSSSSSSATSSSSSSSSSTSSKSITELGGHGDSDLFGAGFDGLGQPSTSHVSTKTVACTRSTRRTIVHTKDGPVERVEEVIEGGPECQAGTSLTKGGISALFPTLSHTSSSSSSSSSVSTKTIHSGGSKGSLLGDSKTGLEDPFGGEVGIDLGAFLTGTTDDDVPDFHARSLNSMRVERQADYIGKVCARLKQQSQDGQKSPSQIQIIRRQECQVKSDITLCSDDDWVFKCPSGCRLQGLISQMESEVERKLLKVCKTVKLFEDANDISTMTTTHIYNSNWRVIDSRHMSEMKFVEQAELLSRNLTSVRKRSSHLAQKLKELRSSVQRQIEDLYRAEVDIDMKLRACRGSCQSALPFTVNHPSYQILQTDMEQMDKTLNQRGNVAVPPKNLPHIKVQSVDVGAASSVEQKTIPTVQKELLGQFEDMRQNRLVLEEANVEVLHLGELE